MLYHHNESLNFYSTNSNIICPRSGVDKYVKRHISKNPSNHLQNYTSSITCIYFMHLYNMGNKTLSRIYQNTNYNALSKHRNKTHLYNSIFSLLLHRKLCIIFICYTLLFNLYGILYITFYI